MENAKAEILFVKLSIQVFITNINNFKKKNLNGFINVKIKLKTTTKIVKI